MGEMNALSFVGQDDIVSLRIICSKARDGKQYSLEEVDSYGNTALLKACYLGRIECALTLLDFGGNIYAINYFGQNALTLASYSGHLPLVKELLRRRSYKDFNMSSMIPALCVAVIEKHTALEEFFTQLDPNGARKAHTVQGLGVEELRRMMKQAERLNKKNASSPRTFLNHRYR
ncbi:DNA replication inhibitor plutonium [Drosophila gunungcola]|uniref:DNA replication inhibitor plutonium n=1 Tax=Drosophila gunungcola TaxID=103775 RepID=UPI0022E8908F|nr:DNA replication inhibitor plutonium [Drosophila gunungcola]